MRSGLDEHLKVMEDDGLIQVWTDSKLIPGDEWQEEILARMNDSQIILFLVSTSFLASKFIKEVEIPLAVRLKDEGKAVIVPIILTHTPALERQKWLPSIQAVPSMSYPVDDVEHWKSTKRAFAKVDEQLRRMIPGVPDSLRKAKVKRDVAPETPENLEPRPPGRPPAPRSRLLQGVAVVAVVAAVAISAWQMGKSQAQPNGTAGSGNGHPTPVPTPAPTPTPLPPGPKLGHLQVVYLDPLTSQWKSIESGSVPAVRIADRWTDKQGKTWMMGYNDADGTNHPQENAIQFVIGLQSIGGTVATPARISYFIRDSEQPAVNRINLNPAMQAAVPLTQSAYWKERGYTRGAAWTVGTPVFPTGDSHPTTELPLAIVCGKEGRIPTGLNEVGLEIENPEKPGEYLYRGEIKLQVLELDPRDAKVKLLSVDGTPLPAVLPARRMNLPTFWIDGQGTRHTVENAIQFGIGAVSVRGEVPAPLLLEYFLRTSEKPLPGRIVLDSTILPGLVPVGESDWSAKGYTMTAGFALLKKDETWKLSATLFPMPDLTIICGKDGSIPKGEHEIGLQVRNPDTQEVLYRTELKLMVPE